MQQKTLYQRKKKYFLLVLLLFAVGMTKTYAYDFSAVCETGQTLYYNITNATNHYVALTCPGAVGYNGWSGYTQPTGNIILPENVQNNGITYTVTSIGNYAFDFCYGLTGSLNIPNSVTSIGYYAFSGCWGLTSIFIPSSVTYIATNPFESCHGLAQIIVDSESTVYDSRENCNAIIKTSTNELVTGCKNTVIPNSVISIGANAFRECNSLTSISIPNSVIAIGSDAFEYCGLTSIFIPNSVTYIGTNPFQRCSGLSQIIVDSGNTVYDSREDCNAIIKTSTNELVTGCKNTVIPISVASIGYSAFRGCGGLKSIVIPNHVTSIGMYAFYNCYNLVSVTFSNSVITIGHSAFEDCYNIKLITFGNSVASIGPRAFYSYYSYSPYYLTILAETPPTLDFNYGGVFTNVDKTIPVYVPYGTSEAYMAADGWNEFTNFIEMAPTYTISAESDPIGAGEVSIIMEESTLVCEPFEEYPEGNKIASSAIAAGHDWWTTWGNAPGSSQDGVVANFDNTQCGHLTYGNDLVFLLSDKRNGNYDIEFDILVPNGKNGFFNILHHFGGSNSIWAMQCYLHSTNDGQNTTSTPGHGTIHAGSNNTADLPCVYDAWMHFRLNVDIDNDTARYYYTAPGENEILICEWQWSLDSFGEFVADRTLAALNFYPPLNTATSEFYLDNISIKQKSGDVFTNGSNCSLTATPNQGYLFENWTNEGNIVSDSTTYSFTVTGNANYVANFSFGLPELHVTGITHSALMAGQQATISWTVQNDGVAPTPNGALWHDRVWLSVESRVAADDNNPILLATFDNLSALAPGEYYTQTQTFTLPIDFVGEYYLFVLTDAYDCHTIYWGPDGVPLPYSPPPFFGCLSHHCYSCPNVADNRIYEQSEYAHGDQPGGYYNDNFFYELVDIEVPILPDLQVTSIIPQTNFFSGSMVSVSATISNLGENTTLTDHWADALYIASEPDFNSPSTVCIAAVLHSGQLGVGQSYQVQFAGQVPLTMYGEAYFFVYTDCYEQVYEHVLNHNNIMMSDAVNIILSPPADLTPSNLSVPATVSTGETFAYSYKVYNNGAGDPNVNNWVDRIYLCQNADTLDANAVLLKTINHYGGLHHGANYSISESMVLPLEITSGNYYLYVHADADNDVFEYLYDGNNLARSNAIHVTRPDLQVFQISAPEQITGGYPLNLSYTLTNVGEGIVRNRMVTDRVYISASGNMTDTIRIANIRRNVYLAAGQSLTVICNDLVPYNLTDGTYHLLVMTDCGNDINESNEGNNTLSHYPMSVFHQPLPDLQPVSLTIPEVIQAGGTIPVEFDITNIGDLDLLNSNCTFNIYAAWGDNEILCPVQSQTLPLGNTVSICIGQTVHFVRSVLVLPTVTSACSTFELIANRGGLVPELDTTNNVYTATATVLDCPLPDLIVTNITANAMQSGVENQISFTVNNVGTADFEGSFNMAVYVRSVTDTILCPLVLQVSPTTNNYTIPIGGTLSFTQKVLVPPMANASCNLLEIIVDEENQVLETNDDNNATTIVSTVINYPFDLKTTALQVPESVWAGETTSLTWTVKNIGTCPSEAIPLYVNQNGTYTLVQGEILPQPWMDKVFVSNDAVLSDDDIELCSVARSTVLQPNGTYAVEHSVTVPYTNLGAQYLLCVSDATRVTYDSDTLNNVKTIPIEVQLGVLPDLRIISLTVEEELTSDQAYWVHYTVVNEGERVTQKENWTDAFFIGEAMTTVGALQLGAKIHYGALEVGESYTDSIEILIPNGLEGDYFLMGFTDRTNQIYEHDNEDDNLLAVPVNVMAPPPCDLIAVQPDFPASVISGEEMTVSWQLRNIGYNPAVGRIRNAVYLSRDDAWSSDDVMLGYADMAVNIVSNAQQPCSLSSVLTNVPEGNYYVIVKANILNALNESSYENNICVSMLTTEVCYPTLAIGEQVDRTLAADQYIYYKLVVGAEYEGQTFSCTLTTAEQQVANGLYLSHETVPSMSQYDFGQYVPYTQEINVLIPVLEQGVYYLLAKGTTQSGNPQQVSIATSVINFEILSIDADHGTNTGSITTKVIGAKFDSIMDFRLVKGGDYLPAEKVFFSNSTETFTTFNLTEMPLGTYAMEAELPGGIITIKGDAFTIEEGLPAELAVNIVAPSSVRRGTTFSVNIEYGNVGTTDLNVSGFVVVSRNGHPIGITTEELFEGQTELTFYTGEDNGNPDVLRPGYRGTRSIMVTATPSSNVSLAVYAIRRQY